MNPEEQLRPRVEEAFADRNLLGEPDHRYAIEGTLTALDRGEIRVASPPATDGGEWTTHAWVTVSYTHLSGSSRGPVP